MLPTPPPHPCTHHASVNCHPDKVFNYFKYKLVGRHKGIWKLALEESQLGTTGSIWRANDEAFYELISQRGRGGSFRGLEMIKIAADSNIEKMAFLLQLVLDPARLQWPALTSLYERSYRPPRGGGGVSHFTHLNFKTSRVGVYKCVSLTVGFAVTVAIWPREVVSCRDFILRAVATFWVMSLVRLYPGRASGESFLFISLKKLELTDALLSHMTCPIYNLSSICFIDDDVKLTSLSLFKKTRKFSSN